MVGFGDVADVPQPRVLHTYKPQGKERGLRLADDYSAEVVK